MPDRLDGFLDRALVGAAALGLRHPAKVILGTAALLGLSILSVLRMTFHSEVKDLVPASSAKAFQRLEEVFGTSADAFLLVSSKRTGSETDLVAFAEAIASKLRTEPLVRSVTFGWSDLGESFLSAEVLSHAPLFARPSEIGDLEHLLTPQGISDQVRKLSLQLSLPGLGEAEKWALKDPLDLRRFLLSRISGLKGTFRLQPASMHFLSQDGRSLLIRIEGSARSSDIPKVKALVRSIRSAVESTKTALEEKTPGALDFEIGLTGSYAFAFEAEAAVRGDLTRNIWCSMALILGLVAFTFRSALLLVPSMTSLVVGIVLGFGALSLFRREVVTLAFVSGALLAGLGIDYVVYITLRAFSDARGPTKESLLDAFRATGRSMLFAALTTAAAFFAFPLTGESFLTDLGMLSGVGILTSLATTLIVLPALLLPWIRRGDRGGYSPGEILALRPRTLGAQTIAYPGLAWPSAIFWLSVLSGLGSALYLFVRPPEVEKDLRNIHPASSEAIRTQEAIAKIFGGSETPILILLEATRPSSQQDRTAKEQLTGKAQAEAAALEAATRLEAPLQTLLDRGVIAAWSSPVQFIPAAAEQEQAIDLLSRADPLKLEAAFRAALESEGFEPSQFVAGVNALRDVLLVHEAIGPKTLRQLGLSSELDRMLGSSGGLGYALIVVQPARPLWESKEHKRIFDELEGMIATSGVRGEITGIDVISAKSAAAILDEFLKVTGFSTVAVVLLVFILFRDFLSTFLALLPVTLGTLWMAVACDLLGIKLNFMNVGILPMVLGTGVDVGIHMVRQYLDDPGQSVESLLGRIGTSIMLASLTTLASFGTMAYSVSRGLSSVGAISGLGMLGCLLASLVSLTAALQLHSRRARAGRE